jgi:hypothetical protein
MSHWRDEHDNGCDKLELPGLKEPLYLEHECWSCHGKEGVTGTEYPYDSENNGQCVVCKGKGFCPSESGEAIIRFLKNHGG